ncbi:MAG: O-phosphoseryl-tRNA(Sec) selenium transferase [Candidatus Thorarchaeota archaeon]|nr:O-phosphoseryl-tRNA(Sec) selenium transferase [Candidatus Thorarchaeota archaeon]
MEDEIEKRISEVLPPHMAVRGLTTLGALLNPVKDVINRRHFPKKALDDVQVEWLIRILSSLDSDKDPEAARVGEREGRAASPLIGRLSLGFNHGIGRSGHVTNPQPKAVGASLMQNIANTVAVDAIRKLGLSNVRHGFVVPLSTGMTIALVLAALRREFGVRQVLYPRLDHLSPKRAIAMAGLEEVSIPNLIEGDAVQTDLSALERLMRPDSGQAVLATTTFFPPREPDPVKEIARLCAERNTPLVINNAYGVQSAQVMALIRAAVDAGRVDAIVQSSDKNFLAPVGASIVVSPHSQVIEWTAATYAGRASAAPVVQTLAAMLVLGEEGYVKLRQEQTENRAFLQSRIEEIASTTGQRVLDVVSPIACAMTVGLDDARRLGAYLYERRVTGPRVVVRGEFGACVDNYPESYVVVNSAIGARRVDVESASTKLLKGLTSLPEGS